MKRIHPIVQLAALTLALNACSTAPEQSMEQKAVSPVKIVRLKTGRIVKTITFYGKTVILKKERITTPLAGYVAKVAVHFGDPVQKNQLLFELQSKESAALGETAGNGQGAGVRVVAPAVGYISELAVSSTGSYVSEGDYLCSITSDENVLVQVNIPYENRTLATPGTACRLNLPDNTSIRGTVVRLIPTLSPDDQTMDVLVQPSARKHLPENLNVVAVFTLPASAESLLIPREALLADETQREFRVMKMVGDSMAISVPVTRLSENDSLVQIQSPLLSTSDFIIYEGAFGLPDSSLVTIE